MQTQNQKTSAFIDSLYPNSYTHIKMLHNSYGCDDGHTSQEYLKGRSYEIGVDIGQSLAGHFLLWNQAIKTKK